MPTASSSAPCRSPNAVFETAKRLKVVSRHGVGYNNVDVDYLTELGIPLALTIDANALSVAEHTMFFLLALAKNGLVYDRATRENRFGIRESLDCIDISGKTLLIVGFGRIGRMVAERAKAFGMKVAVSDPMVAAGGDRRCRLLSRRGACRGSSARRFPDGPCSADEADEGHDRRGGARADAAERLRHQHRTRRDRRRKGADRGAHRRASFAARRSMSSRRSRPPRTILCSRSTMSSSVRIRPASRSSAPSGWRSPRSRTCSPPSTGRLDPAVVVNRQVLSNQTQARVA